MLKRELCNEHADQLRATELFGGKPNEEKMEEDSSVACGIETMQLYGKRTTKRVYNCSNRASVRFGFGMMVPIERIQRLD